MRKYNIADLLTYIISAELVGALSALLSGGFSLINIRSLRCFRHHGYFQ